MEVGIDLEQNNRFNNVSEKFLNRVFTDNEILYAKKYNNVSARLCAMWCIKESVIKAFSDSKLSLKDIEVYHDNNKPKIVLTQKIISELNLHNAKSLKISVSHSKDYSTSICILE